MRERGPITPQSSKASCLTTWHGPMPLPVRGWGSFQATQNLDTTIGEVEKSKERNYLLSHAAKADPAKIISAMLTFKKEI